MAAGDDEVQALEQPSEPCPYGEKCYRQNPSHFQEYSHPASHPTAHKKRSASNAELSTGSNGVSLDASSAKKAKSSHTLNPIVSTSTDGISELFQRFFITTVTGINEQFNAPGWTISLRGILSPKMGNLQTSIQFNYMFDIPWMMQQYPPEFRDKPLLVIHGYKATSGDAHAIRNDAAKFANISVITAPLEIPFGTHHTKMMILRYDTGIRVVVHTANLIHEDWHQKTQGVWISPVLTKPADGSAGPDSVTYFKRDFVDYLRQYRLPKLSQIADEIALYDMSSVRVALVASVPGRHTGQRMDSWGHRKLRSLLKEHCNATQLSDEWPVIGQFSSIGSIGPKPEAWLTGEFYESLCAPSQITSLTKRPSLNLIFPSVDNVRFSLEGWRGGGSLPYSMETAKKQPYLHKLFHVWKSEALGRTHAMPHIKTYTRISPDLSKVPWLLVTSANLSKAAWGAIEKQSQLMIRSYELGVLILPKFSEPAAEFFTLVKDCNEPPSGDGPFVFLPYDLPLEEYRLSDQPWTYDAPQTGLLDRYGRKRRGG